MAIYNPDICPNCGSRFAADDVNCPTCGKNLDKLFNRINIDDMSNFLSSILDSLKNHKIFGHILPIIEALIFYLFALIVLLINPEAYFITIIIATVYSIIGPIIYMSLPRWWINTILFILSWIALLTAIEATIEMVLGRSIEAAAMAFLLPVYGFMCVLPLTGLVRFGKWRSDKKRKAQNERE